VQVRLVKRVLSEGYLVVQTLLKVCKSLVELIFELNDFVTDPDNSFTLDALLDIHVFASVLGVFALGFADVKSAVELEDVLLQLDLVQSDLVIHEVKPRLFNSIRFVGNVVLLEVN
jgi:hypothetical protein